MWTPTTGQAVAAVAGVRAPRTKGRVRRQLMQVYVQKSISTTRPRRLAMVRGRPPRVEPALRVRELGRGAEVLQPRPGSRGGERRGWAAPRARSAGARAGRRAGPHCARALDRARGVDQERRDVPRQRGLEAHVELERHDERGGHEHSADRPLEGGPATGAPDPLQRPAAPVGEQGQHRRQARGVGQRDGDEPGGRSLRGTDRDRRQRGWGRHTARRRSRARRPRPGPTRTRVRFRAARIAPGETAAPRSGRRSPARRAPGRRRRAR